MIDFMTANFWVYLTFVGLLGLAIGSFINVVIHRLPIMLERDWREQYAESLDSISNEKKTPYNLSRPASHCPQCLVKLSVWHNIPVISYVVLGGKCASCKRKIPFRYLLVELLSLIFH